MRPPDGHISVSEAADISGASKATIRRRVAEGRLAGQIKGRQLFVNKQALLELYAPVPAGGGEWMASR